MKHYLVVDATAPWVFGFQDGERVAWFRGRYVIDLYEYVADHRSVTRPYIEYDDEAGTVFWQVTDVNVHEISGQEGLPVWVQNQELEVKSNPDYLTAAFFPPYPDVFMPIGEKVADFVISNSEFYGLLEMENSSRKGFVVEGYVHGKNLNGSDEQEVLLQGVGGVMVYKTGSGVLQQGGFFMLNYGRNSDGSWNYTKGATGVVPGLDIMPNKSIYAVLKVFR